MKPVEIVTITTKIPIYKDGAEASNIEVLHFKYQNGDNCAYNLVAQKGLHEIGGNAVFIQPDYCLSDIHLFESFIRPFGDEKKCRLGKNYRIRAIKFNFSFAGSMDPIYSFGILLPYGEVFEYLCADPSSDTIPKHVLREMMDDAESDFLQTALGIIKYEEPESAGSGLAKGDFPSFMYKTDEVNIQNFVDRVEQVLAQGQELGFTIKRDGSSWTGYFKKAAPNSEHIYGICSRSMEKKLEQTVVTNYKDGGNIYHPYFLKEKNEKGWYCDDTQKYLSNDEVAGFEQITEIVRDSWIELANDGGYIEKIMNYCKEHNIELAVRGELCGTGLKGSGNKNNPDAKNKQSIILFGVDSLDTGFSVRLHYADKHNLATLKEATGLPVTDIVYTMKGGTYADLENACKKIFEEEKQAGRVIEGVVIRTMHSNDISVKYMNPEYDSKK